MPAAPLAWPPALAGTPAISVIERAIERQRLAHSLLLHGENLGTLANVAHAIADRLLNDPRHPSQHFPPKQHPDFFALRPAGKSRQIGADPTRSLIGQIQVSPQISRRKVAVIYEADRMNTAAANIFLKTLEEPPGSATILLLTTRPYALLPTIRSRCLHFRFTDDGHAALAEASPETAQVWAEVLQDYAEWLTSLLAGGTDKRAIADRVMGIYGLVTRFNSVLAAATSQAWAQQKDKLPEGLEDDEVEAIQTGISNGIRLRLFAELEHATRQFALAGPASDADATKRRAMTAAVRELEHSIGLLRLNLNEAAALENFLLASLRIWSRK